MCLKNNTDCFMLTFNLVNEESSQQNDLQIGHHCNILLICTCLLSGKKGHSPSKKPPYIDSPPLPFPVKANILSNVNAYRIYT